MCLPLSKVFGRFLSGFLFESLGRLTGLSRVFRAYLVRAYEVLDFHIRVSSVVLQGILVVYLFLRKLFDSSFGSV